MNVSFDTQTLHEWYAPSTLVTIFPVVPVSTDFRRLTPVITLEKSFVSFFQNTVIPNSEILLVATTPRAERNVHIITRSKCSFFIDWIVRYAFHFPKNSLRHFPMKWSTSFLNWVLRPKKMNERRHRVDLILVGRNGSPKLGQYLLD